MDPFSRTLARITVEASSLLDGSSLVLLNVAALLASEEPEKATRVPVLGGLGLLGRPKAPDASGRATGLAARIGDALAPFALVDARISQARGAIAEGAISLAGYLGQHLTLEDGTGGGARITIRAGSLSITLEAGGIPPTTTILGRTVVAPNEGAVSGALPVAVMSGGVPVPSTVLFATIGP